MNDVESVEPFSDLKSLIATVACEEAASFRLTANMQIVAAMRERVRTPATQDAAAAAAKDCGELAADVAQGGSAPNKVWETAIQDDRERALSSLERLSSLLAASNRVNWRDGRAYDRSSSVMMRKKRYNQPAPQEALPTA